VLVSVVAGGSTNNSAVTALTQGAYVQAVIRGPAFPTPQTIVASPNSPLLLPQINLVGQYELDSIALVDAQTGAVRLEGSPSSVPINVFNQLLISSVTSQPLSLDQIQQAGITIDDSSFRAVQFNVEFSVNGQTIPVTFPVVSPTFTESTELIPADEVQAQLTTAALINQQIASKIVQLPPQLTTAGLNIQVQGLNFQPVDPSAGQSLSLAIPPIPAIMVIPGSIGYLHEFFSVQIFTENGAPNGSGLTVGNLQATLQLPPGQDGIVSTNWAQPGDNPLRFARLGSNNIVQPTQQIVDPGPDGILGDGDDISLLQPGETGQAQFFVEGLQEGLFPLNINLTGTLYGLAAGPVAIGGSANGSVLVRNPSFSMTFTFPDVVRTGEPYTASINVLNTGTTPANLVQVTLNQNSISGAILAPGQNQTIQLGTIASGQTAVATYHMIAETTGQIQFSDLTTSDASVTGQFNFSMAVDSQGVPLSPDTIAMPDYVTNLPPDLVAAANVVLGEALSIATAAQLPPGIVSVDSAIITRRVLDLAEAGQRVQYGDPLSRVLPDLLRDWQGGRVPDDGFDSLLRTAPSGQVWRTTLFQDMEKADNVDGTQRALNQASDLAGLGQQFVLASAGPGQLWADFTGITNNATADYSSEPYSMVYYGTNGEWAVTPFLTNAVFTWTFTNAPPTADMAVLLVDTNGQVQEFRWQVSSPPVSAVYTFALSDTTQRLQVDTNGDGIVDTTLAPSQSVVNELPPALIAVQQDLTVLAGRPSQPCYGPPFYNYGTVVAVVYSKPMTQASAGATNSYTVDGNNGADSVQIQPSGRVALLNLRKGISAIIPRKLTVTGVTDVRGNALVASPTPIQCFYPNTTNLFTGGVAVRGRVLLGSGSPAVDVPVTLTMYDGQATPDGCQSVVRRVSQVLTDSGGNYNFDYVMSGIPYSMSASDTSDLSTNALALIEQTTTTTTPDSDVLQQLIAASSNPNSILSLLSAGSVDQAVAIVQGLDRAVVDDTIGIGSSREGQTVPIVLQFRGRGTVAGFVVASDGVTPVQNAAVNLYPDPSTLELGRGVFSDGTGAFSFPGVPLGVFTVQVSTSDRRGATVSGLLSSPGQSTNITIALPDTQVFYGTLQGTVYDSDNITPIANASVYVGHYAGTTMKGVVAIVTSDPSGTWIATNVPIATWDVAAVTFDGSRVGVRQGIGLIANQPTYVNITLEAATTVYGQVQFDNGKPVPNALIAGGTTLVYSDANGNFQLQGVPVGNATISAGLQANPAAGIPFTRLGSANANVVAGTANYVVVKLNAAGQIYGKVFDSQGNIQPNVTVAIPDPIGGGFFWTDADANGNYSFPNLGLGGYTISAPANAVAPQLDQSQISQQLSSGDESQILAAFQEAVTVFTGVDDPLLNGDDLNFAPSAWGYTTASLNFDGASVNADIHYIPQGTLTGKVLNGQGIPIGAEVELTGLGPDPTGAPTTTVRGEVTSDPATGFFGFTNVLLAGNWGLQAASPFYPVVIQTNGFTTVLDLNVSGIILQFPPVNDVNGSIAGFVFNPDGSAENSNVQVHINIATNYQILTDSNGFFNTQTEFPAIGVTYEVDAFDPLSGLRGQSFISMTPGITNFVNVNLISRTGEVQVTVKQADGTPAPGAQLELDQGSYPFGPPLFAVTDTNGLATFTSLWIGNYSVMGEFTENSTRLFARGGVNVTTNQIATITLTMGATGTIQGTFVKQDLVTPVNGANVSIGNLGFASTDTNGFFQFEGVPLGNYTITSSDPVTGGNAVTTTTMSYNGQVQTVSLVEATLGTVSGLVTDPYSTGFAAGASIAIGFSDGVTPSRTVTSGPTGAFSFPGSPMGSFTLNANYTLPGTQGFMVSGHATGTLSPQSNNVSVNIQLQPLTALTVQVLQHDGVTPATNVVVTANNTQQDTTTNGTAFFNNLRAPANYGITAISQLGGDMYDGAQTNVTVNTGTNPIVTLVLPGVGSVTGTVVGSDGSTPVDNADVILTSQASLFSGQNFTALTGPTGTFSFPDLPLGPYNITAASLALAASQSGSLTNANQANVVTLRLGSSGTIIGELVRADGVTPVGNEDILIQYGSQSSNPGRDVFYTGTNGMFVFSNVPIGQIEVSSAAPDFDGIINFTTLLSSNGQVLNLGLVPFDETYPAVSQVTPSNGTIGVSISNSVLLLFTKALASNSINNSGIFIQGTNGIVTSTVTLQTDTNGMMDLVRVTPNAPLQSLATYSVIVLAGELIGSTGGVIGSGPTDLVGRPLNAPFEADFTTADQTPPILLSIFPSNNAVQIDPISVPRLVFNKTLNPTNFVFILTGSNGPVSGTASVGINGQVLTFLPTLNLSANATYSMVVSNVYDLAGNLAVGQPYTASFATIDTIGPVITSLQIASNATPLAGATIPVVAVISTNEHGASVAFTQDFNSVGAATNSPYQVMVTLPSTGSTTIRAIATDQYGNQGQVVSLTIAVQLPQPPTIHFDGVFADGLAEGARTNYFTVTQTDPGLYSIGGANGALQMQKITTAHNPGGLQNVAVNLNLPTVGGAISNDFSVQVAFSNAVIGPGLDQVQLNMGLQDGSVFDDVFDNSSGTNAHVWIGSVKGLLAVSNNFGTFRISRQGAILTGYFNNVPLFSETNASAVTNLNFVLQNNGSDDSSSVAYNNFSITAPSIPNQPVLTGSLVALEVTASGDTSISNLTAIIGGAASGAEVMTNGSEVLVQGYVPSTASPSQPVQVFAQVVDILGVSSAQQILSLPVIDGTPPFLSIPGLTNNAHVVAAPSFSVAAVVSDNSSNVTLNLTISGSLTNQQSAALALTPNVSATNVFTVSLASAPTNGGPITLTLTATDAASNSTVVSRMLWLPNTPGPAIASLVIASNLPPLNGTIVPINATLSSNAPGDFVQFTQDGTLIGIATNVPYQVHVLLPKAGSTTVTAVAVDQFGNVGVPAILTIAVETNVLPSVQFVRVSPASGPVPSGSSFAVNIVASGNSNLFNITASVGGAAIPAAFQALGTNLIVTGSVPATNVAGQQVQITAQAVDGLGQSTGPQVFNLPVSDGTAPSLALLNPAPNAQLAPSQTIPITVLVGDNSSGVTLSLMVTSSVLTNTQTVPVTLTPNVPATNVLTLSLPNEPTNGSPIFATITATDAAGNSTTLNEIFWLPGTQTTVTWDRQALGQTLNCTNGPGTYTYPNNANWSQSQVFGTPCGAGLEIPVQPSNWSTTNYPNGTNLDVLVGTIGGAPANLDVSVALHSLTIQTGGGLNMANGTTLSAVNFELQTDGSITRNNSASLAIAGGTMEKSAGTNTFTIDPGIVLKSVGGTLAVDSGTLALPGNNSLYTNGAMNVASNATLALIPSGNAATFAGMFTGSGAGTVLFAGGTLDAGGGGVTFDLPSPLFQWTGGEIVSGNPLTNAGVMDMAASNNVELSGTMANTGLFVHSGTGGLGFDAGPSTHFENLASGTYQFESGPNLYAFGCCGGVAFDNFGTVSKIDSFSNAIIQVAFNNKGGLVNVETGTLTLDNSGVSSNGSYSVSAGATLDLTGGQSPTWAGLMVGQGSGTVALATGTLTASPSADLNFANGLFQWSGGRLAGLATNLNTLVLASAADSSLGGQLYNANLIRHTGSGRLGLDQGTSSGVHNLAGGTYQFEADSSVYAFGCCGPVFFENDGLLRKIGGTNTSSINISFNNPGGTVEVDTGTIALANNGSSSNGTFNVAAGATLDITGGNSPTWAGQIGGTGGGTLQLSSGELIASALVLNCPPGLFQWTGGTLKGTAVNSNVVTIPSANNVDLSGTISNAGLFVHSGVGGLGLDEGPSSHFENLSTGTYQFESGASIYLYGCCGGVAFDNFGTVSKIDSFSNANISVAFNNKGGLVNVETGTLTLNNSGVSSNGTYSVSAGATLDVTGGASPTWAGEMTGLGAGAVALATGTLTASPSADLNFANGLFQWSGGRLAGLATNLNTLVLVGVADSSLGGQLYNANLIRHTGSGRLGLDSGPSSGLHNLAGGTYQFETDSSLYAFGCCGPVFFENDGLLRKIGGTNTSSINISFNNLGGTVEVDTGTIALANNGSSFNGNFNVAAGATLDVTGGASPAWGGQMNGQGAGAVVFASGTLTGNPSVALNFTNGLFQWSGGRLAGLATNLNTLVLASATDSSLGGQLYNAGLIRHTGSGRLGLDQGPSATLHNLPTGTYQFESDSSLYAFGCCGPVSFANQGLLRKSAGTNTSAISISFSNYPGASIEVDSGTLSLGGSPYAQGGGTFIVQLGGTNGGQNGELLAGPVTLNGPLNLKLAAGFIPAVGTKFPILSGSSLSGNFTSLNIPSGITIVVSNTTVIASVTSQITSSQPGVLLQNRPTLAISKIAGSQATLQWNGATNFVLETASPMKAGTRWIPVTNIPTTVTSNTFNVTLPITNAEQYFRLRQQSTN
jgi:hypothetical protein